MSECPYCGAEAATPKEETEHMSAVHPEIVAERLRGAGFIQREQDGPWIDTLAGDHDA